MTLDRFETHDRLIEIGKQADQISQGLADCVSNRPQEFANLPFYVFAHARSTDDGINKRILWQSRLTKPRAQTNSMLFKIYVPDNVRVVWMLPDEPLWPSFHPDKMTHDPLIWTSILDYLNDRKKLEAGESDDLSFERVRQIYMEIGRNQQNKLKPILLPDS